MTWKKDDMPVGLGCGWTANLGLLGDASLVSGNASDPGDIDLWVGGTKLGTLPKTLLADETALFREAEQHVRAALRAEWLVQFNERI